jgi:hypothetical protein
MAAADESVRWEWLHSVRISEVLVSLAWSPALANPLPGGRGRYTLAFLVDSCNRLRPGKGQPPRL